MFTTGTGSSAKLQIYVRLSLPRIPLVETVIHKNVLNLFLKSARSRNRVEYDILESQLVMKEPEEISWCNGQETFETLWSAKCL